MYCARLDYEKSVSKFYEFTLARRYPQQVGMVLGIHAYISGQTVTSSTHWGCLQSSVTDPESRTSQSEAIVLSQKLWIALSGLGASCRPTQRSSSNSQAGGLVWCQWCRHCAIMVKRELSKKAKFLIYQSSYIPTLTYDHELWVLTERMGSWISVAEISFPLRSWILKVDPNCTFCHTGAVGTFYHTIWECPGVAKFWKVVKENWSTILHIPVPLWPSVMILNDPSQLTLQKT